MTFDCEERGLHTCPFEQETGRRPKKRKPCPPRYQETCGCQDDGIPRPRERWKRHGG